MTYSLDAWSEQYHIYLLVYTFLCQNLHCLFIVQTFQGRSYSDEESDEEEEASAEGEKKTQWKSFQDGGSGNQWKLLFQASENPQFFSNVIRRTWMQRYTATVQPCIVYVTDKACLFSRACRNTSNIVHYLIIWWSHRLGLSEVCTIVSWAWDKLSYISFYT